MAGEPLAHSPDRASAKGGRFMRSVAGALSAAPVGFAAGAVLGGRYLVDPGSATGIVVLGFALTGAALAATGLATATALLPPKPARIATLVAGVVSFGILAYMVSDYIVDRVEKARAFDDAYAGLGPFELTLESTDRRRRPFSELTFESDSALDTRDYTALRPGGWLCRGRGNREHTMALFRGVRAAEGDGYATGRCSRRASWRIAGEAPTTDRCADAGDGFAALFAAADEMIEETKRYASCRRAAGLRSRQSAGTIPNEDGRPDGPREVET